MLVLSRAVKQAVIIGDDEIEIQILSIEKGRVRLGIRAPRTLTVDRAEIFLRKQAEKAAKDVA
jgi:carbon storage regulator